MDYTAPGAPTAGSARLAALYERPMAALCAAGADLLWIESQCDLGESLAALGVARRMGRAAVVTFTPHRTSGGLRIADGTPAEDCLAAAQAGGAAAAGVNCLDPDPALAELAAWAAERLRIPFVAKPSAGLPGAVLPPGAFAEAMAAALRAGLRVAGGCCGTTGEHIRALGAAMTGSP